VDDPHPLRLHRPQQIQGVAAVLPLPARRRRDQPLTHAAHPATHRRAETRPRRRRRRRRRATCHLLGQDVDRRDTALIRVLFDSGGRLAEVAGLTLDDIDTTVDLFRLRGKGNKQRAVPFGPKTGQALTRYMRLRAKHKGAELDALWLAERGARPLNANGVKIMLRRRGEQAQLDGRMHAHRFRHTLAHQWLASGGHETDLMRLMGWSSREMLLRYGASAGQQRAQNAHRRMGLGDRV
jgi:site-specific recombinase XerD